MSLTASLDRLMAFDQVSAPVVSLYLNTQPDERGRDNFEAFIRKEFKNHAQQFEGRSPELASYERDVERIQDYLRNELRPSANGVAIFACADANDFFEAVQTDSPIQEHQFYVASQPVLLGLAYLEDQFPPYATLVVDTNKARLYVFGFGETLEEREVSNVNVHRAVVGGWSQARYQRHIDNYHQQHAKEVVEELERVAREEQLRGIILAGDEVVLPTLRQQMPQALQNQVIDTLRLDITTPEHEVRAASLAALRAYDGRKDAEQITQLLEVELGKKLVTLGAHDTLLALVRGQVEELFINAPPQLIQDDLKTTDAEFVPSTAVAEPELRPVLLADELVRRTRQTSARVTFIEDTALLAPYGGVAAKLRFSL